jgi:hypothetical protein
MQILQNWMPGKDIFNKIIQIILIRSGRCKIVAVVYLESHTMFRCYVKFTILILNTELNYE